MKIDLREGIILIFLFLLIIPLSAQNIQTEEGNYLTLSESIQLAQ